MSTITTMTRCMGGLGQIPMRLVVDGLCLLHTKSQAQPIMLVLRRSPANNGRQQHRPEVVQKGGERRILQTLWPLVPLPPCRWLLVPRHPSCCRPTTIPRNRSAGLSSSTTTTLESCEIVASSRPSSMPSLPNCCRTMTMASRHPGIG